MRKRVLRTKSLRSQATFNKSTNRAKTARHELWKYVEQAIVHARPVVCLGPLEGACTGQEPGGAGLRPGAGECSPSTPTRRDDQDHKQMMRTQKMTAANHRRSGVRSATISISTRELSSLSNLPYGSCVSNSYPKRYTAN